MLGPSEVSAAVKPFWLNVGSKLVMSSGAMTPAGSRPWRHLTLVRSTGPRASCTSVIVSWELPVDGAPS